MKKTAKLILLAIEFLPAPISGQAPENIPSASGEVAPEAKVTAKINRPLKDSRWFARLGLVGVPYHSSATIATNGQLLQGATAQASSNFSTTFDLGYDITKNISASVFSGFPPN